MASVAAGSPSPPTERGEGAGARHWHVGRVVLDLDTGVIQAGPSTGHLRPMSAAILGHLARHRHAPVPAKDLAAVFALRSSVDVVSAARQAITLLRAELRVLGLDTLVVSQRGVGYWLDPGVAVEVRRPIDRPGRARLRGRAHARSRDKAGVVAGGPAPAGPASPVAGTIGVVDIDTRSLWFAGRRLLIGNERDFMLLTTLLLADGGPVTEQHLMSVCRYQTAKSGPELLRRATRRVNAVLRARGVDVVIKADAAGYGSSYSLEAFGAASA